MNRKLTHLDTEGRARMVDVSAKPESLRRATATGQLVMNPETLRMVEAGDSKKGNVMAVAEVAGIMAAKRTGELIPLCHVLPAVNVRLSLEPDPELPGLVAHAEAVVSGGTGVEMEALTAVSVALLTAYDMAKAMDRGMRIEGVRLLSKEGGRSGAWEGR